MNWMLIIIMLAPAGAAQSNDKNNVIVKTEFSTFEHCLASREQVFAQYTPDGIEVRNQVNERQVVGYFGNVNQLGNIQATCVPFNAKG